MAFPAVAPSAPPPLPPYEQALTDLALVLRHRLSSLTSSIEGYADLLVDTLGSRDQRDMALRIFEGVRGIESVLTELDLVGVEVTPQRASVDLDAMVAEMQAALGPDARRLCWFAEPQARVEADPLLLRQALLILLKNALEAAPRGSVVLDVHEEAGALAFDVLNEGVPAVPADRLFAPFYTTKCQHLGLGLGLARRIAEAHGGTLVLHHASAQQGTCFRLTVPRGA